AQNIYVVASAGCNGVSGSGSITGNLIPHVAPINDPYANVPQPGSHDPSCTNTSPTAANTITGGSVTLSPGNYCGGLSITGGASVTLNPGVYVIDGGSFQSGGNGGGNNGTVSINGTGVTIFLTGGSGNYATMQAAGNANLVLTPPTTGDSAGISIFQD